MNLVVNDKGIHKQKVQRYKSSPVEIKSHMDQFSPTSFKQAI